MENVIKGMKGRSIMRLKEFRVKAGLTQVDLAEKVGVKQSTIAMLETGKNKSPRIEVAKKICKVLGCTMDELYSE
jgi:DNA-binding XRE family transcriptional regulator